jgi:hypothetical protein
LRRVFGSKRDEVTGEWRKLHNEELNDLYSLPNIVRVVWRGQGISKRSLSWNLLKLDICRVTKGLHIEHL